MKYKYRNGILAKILKVIINNWSLPVGLLIASILILVFIQIFKTPTKVSDGTIFILTKNDNTRSIAYRLIEEKIIDNPIKFMLLAKLLNYDRKLKRGRYYLQQGMDELSALKILVKGEQTNTMVTIPEGRTLVQIAEILENYGICSKKEFLKIVHSSDFLNSIGIKANSAEGFLFPDSYEFEIFSDAKIVISRMVKQFFSVYNSLLLADSLTYYDKSTKNYLNLNEIVILAAIIEAEAKLDSERPIIASVFINRLKRRLPLQSCATIEYILKERKPKLSIQDLNVNSPYNTYLNLGLPPGPICNPGRSSLKAVLFPMKTDYLYFVSRGDGSHHFSKTNREHQAAIRNYRNREGN